ncbi:MAG: response regulator [Cyanobacteriota bacterium]|jgi:twitching motility two-component system response regulator PilG
MQGTLAEIDLRSILQLIALGQRTGELLIETGDRAGGGFGPDDLPGRRAWFLFFVQGRLVYAIEDRDVPFQRLQDYLRRYDADRAVGLAAETAPQQNNIAEYAELWRLLAKNSLTPIQAKDIILHMSREVFFDILSLRQGRFTFQQAPALDPLLTSFELSHLLAQTLADQRQWQQFYPRLQSPDQSLRILDLDRLKEQAPPQLAVRLLDWAAEGISLRRLARYLHRDLPALARGLQPYWTQGLLGFSPVPDWTPADKPAPAIPRIVCIDDSPLVGKQVETILSLQGYRVLWLGDSLAALSFLFQWRPDLLLCDIAMPRLDGYELCGMLRQSSHFCQTPIVMLTGKEAFLDRSLARMRGATDYLTKPFGEQELRLLVERYLPTPS